MLSFFVFCKFFLLFIYLESEIGDCNPECMLGAAYLVMSKIKIVKNKASLTKKPASLWITNC